LKSKLQVCLIFKNYPLKIHTWRQSFNFFGAILYYSQSGDDPQEDLAKFGYKLHMKAMLKKHPCVLLATYLNHMQTSGYFFFNFDQILAIEIFKKHMILALSIFSMAFWLYITSKKKKGCLEIVKM
jgi:hypothetical protein